MNFLAKHWYYCIPVGLLMLPVLMVFYISISYGYDFPESLECLKALGKENTKFASGNYTEDKFSHLQPGIMGRDVYERIGMPLERHDGDTKWLYSVAMGGTPYFHERLLLLDKGKVTKVIKRFHTPETK